MKLRYKVVIEKAERNYSAYLPDVPGCIATGATVQETVNNLRTALTLHLDAMRADGGPIPQPQALGDYTIETADDTMSDTKLRILTGDTPTGKLHLGHYVGSVENRLALQDDYDCYFLIANKHAFTTRADRPAEIRQSVIDIATDYLAAGIDPNKATMFIQSEVPAIDELTFFFAMLVPFNRVMRNPTLKDEIRDKELGENYSFGFPMYAVGQVADILAFRPVMVPVGEDQLPHLELTREIARRFNQTYCGVNPQTEDKDYLQAGALFPIIEPKLGRVKRLVGLGPPGANGELLKMSKSLNNAIFLSDEPDVVQKKVMGMYTDPKRIRASDPGETDPMRNPLWAFHETFNPDKQWVAEQQEAYRNGKVGDVVIKRRLAEILNALLEPIRERRRAYESSPDDILDVLKVGTRRANVVAEETLHLAKQAMKQDYFRRTLSVT
jgi:tryptophanyl-tRNA synthetase